MRAHAPSFESVAIVSFVAIFAVVVIGAIRSTQVEVARGVVVRFAPPGGGFFGHDGYTYVKTTRGSIFQLRGYLGEQGDSVVVVETMVLGAGAGFSGRRP